MNKKLSKESIIALKEAIKSAEYSRADLADWYNISQVTISKIANNIIYKEAAPIRPVPDSTINNFQYQIDELKKQVAEAQAKTSGQIKALETLIAEGGFDYLHNQVKSHDKVLKELLEGK